MENKPFVEVYQELNGRLIKLLDVMSALCELSALDTQHSHEGDVLERALHSLLHNHDLDCGTIYMQTKGKLQVVASFGWQDELHMGAAKDATAVDSFNLELAQQVAVSKQLRRVNGVSELAQGGDITHTVTGSYIAVPIVINEEMLGVFCAYHPHPDFFTLSHERSLLLFCSFLAQLVMNSRLLVNMEQQVQDRTHKLKLVLEEAQMLKRRYEELSIIDDLTGLHNRRFFFPEAEAALIRAVRYHVPFSLLMIDVDHFKQVNDAHGHMMGDTVLKELADMLKKEARSADILARLGGEEFVLVLPETNEQGAQVLANRICEHMRTLQWSVDGQTIRLSLSIGVAPLRLGTKWDNADSLEQLLQQADAALYYAKEKGRDQCRCHTEIACKL